MSTKERTKYQARHHRPTTSKPQEIESAAPTRAVISVRVSVDRDDQTSTRMQERECRAWCKERGITVVKVVEDLGRSAFSGEPRPGLESGMDIIANGHADLMLVWKMDRFTRNVSDFHELLSRIQKGGGHFGSVKEPFLATWAQENPMGPMLLTLFATLAQMESASIRMRINAWHDKRREDGAIPAGPAPYGYTKRDPETGEAVSNALFIVEDEANALWDMATAILSGASVSSTARKHDMHHSQVRRCLTTPTIAGMRDLGNGELQVSDQWDAILDADTYIAVRDLLLDPTRRSHASSGTGTGRKHLLVSLITCGVDGCAGRVGSKTHHSGTRYQCAECGQGMKMETVDQHISDVMLEALDDATWRDMQARGRSADSSQLAHLTETLETYRDEVDMGLMTNEQYRAKRDKLTARIAELQEAEALSLPNVASIRDAWAGMDLAGKRLVIAAAFSKITLMPTSAALGHTGTKRIIIDMAEAMR